MWYHRNSLVKDELNRLIDEAQNGVKPIEMISLETVMIEIAKKLKAETQGIK